MTSIRFYSNADDRLRSACAWLAASWRQKTSILVFAPDAQVADRLDHLLWTQPAAFIPHCLAGASLAAETPVLIARHIEDVTQDHCLLNLSDEIPPGFSRFEELVEIVSTDDPVRLPARERYRFYRERGYALDSRNVADGF